MDAVRAYLVNRGYTLPSSEWYAHIAYFAEWYKNDVAKFHRYRVYNGQQYRSVDRYKLGMAKTVCEDFANLLLNERITISVGDSAQKWLDNTLRRNSFLVRGNQLLEVAFALGTGAFVEYRDVDGFAVIDYIRADMIYPLSWDNGVITECAFGSLKQSGNDKSWYVQTHTRSERGEYVIENHMINDSGNELALPDGIEPVVKTGSTLPCFQIIKPNIVNNIDLDCPMGISVFGNAIDELKGCDLVYDSFMQEFNLGRKRIFIPLSMAQIKMQQDGTTALAFDNNDLLYYVYQTQSEDFDKPLVIETAIRADEHERGLNRALDLLSGKCGLGSGRYRYEQGAVKTATEVISAKSDLYQSLRKHELLLGDALCGMVEALAYIEGISIEPPVIGFDDSIIEDTQSIMTDTIALVGAGLMSKLRGVMTVQHLGEDEAEKELSRIDLENGVRDIDFDAFGNG